MNASTRQAVMAEIKAARAIADNAEAQGRDLTKDEIAKAKAHLKTAEDMKKSADHGRDMRAYTLELSKTLGLSHDDPSSGDVRCGLPSSKSYRAGRWGDAVIAAHTDGMRTKSLTPTGAVLVDIPAPPPVELGRPVVSLRQIIPWEPCGGVYTFLRQVTRTSNAAVVPTGQRKPTSLYTTQRVQDSVKTIAHLSEGIPRQDLSDAPALQEFLTAEMEYGLTVALEDQILNGSGGDDIQGVANTSGIQTQAAPGVGEDVFTVTRRALTKLEAQGLDATAWVMNPVDFESVELMRNDGGDFIGASAGQALPVESATRRLWSKPVVTSPACAPGTAWLADWAGSTRLYVREEASLSWSENTYRPDALGVGQGASDWERNLVAFRVEGRFGFGVVRPSGIVKVTLT